MSTLRAPALWLALLGWSLVLNQSKLDAEEAQVCKPAPCPWAGIYPTVLTPWSCHGGVDEAALEAQINYQLQGGVHGLLVLGTIGEGEYASMAERAQVINVAVRAARGCVPVVAGIHTFDFYEARAQLRQAKELGASAVLIKYVGDPCPCFDDVYKFFERLTDLSLLPIFYYHYPSQTGVKLPPQDIARILMLPGIVGIKESTLDLDEVQTHMALTAGHGKVFLSGTALNLTQFMDLGGDGAMCPEAALLPGLTVQGYHAYIAGDRRQARAIQRQLFVVAPLLVGGMMTEHTARTLTMTAQDHHVPLPMGSDTAQARLKAALDGLGVCMSPQVKGCLPPLSLHDRVKVHHAVRKMQRLRGCAP